MTAPGGSALREMLHPLLHAEPYNGTRPIADRQRGRSLVAAFIVSALALFGLAPVGHPRVCAAEPLEIEYSTPDGFRVLAHEYRPDTPATGVVIILPDPSEGRAAWIAVSEALRLRGYHVLVTELRGTGGSANQRGVRRDRSRFTRAEQRNARLDAEAAMHYLRTLPDVPWKRVAVVGSGSSLAAAREGRPEDVESSSLVLISPVLSNEGGSGVPAIRRPELIVLSAGDLIGLDAAAVLVPEDRSRECWVVDGSGRMAGLFASRGDLLIPWMDWIDSSLGIDRHARAARDPASP